MNIITRAHIGGRIKIVSFYCLTALLPLMAGCVTTQPSKQVPNLNLSPENMSFEQDADKNQQYDFGLSLTTNESDSLDNLEVLPGLRVKSVREGSAASLAGVRVGDIILALEGSDTNQVDTFNSIAESIDQEQLKLKVRRDTTVYETTMTRPQLLVASTPEELYRLDPIRTRAGYETQVLTNNINQSTVTTAKVVEIHADSPLLDAGVEKGDLIVNLDGRAVESAQDFVNRIHSDYELGDKIQLDILKSGANQPAMTSVDVKLWDPGRYVSNVSFWPFFTYSASPEAKRTSFKFISILGLSLFSYDRDDYERRYSLITYIKWGSDVGELVDETNTEENP